LSLLVLLVVPGVSLAHSNLERSDPADGATLGQAPSEARLWFSEELEPQFTRAVAYDEKRQPVSLGSRVAADDPRLLIVILQPGLASGWYDVDWQSQAKLDGHLVRGTITFGIGVNGPPPRIEDAGNSAAAGTGSALDVLLRWLVLLTTIVVVGSFAFWISQSHALAAVGATTLIRPRILPGQWVLAELAWILFVLANLSFIANAASAATEATSLDDLGPPLVQLVTQTTFGQLWLARLALAVALGIVLLQRGKQLCRDSSEARPSKPGSPGRFATRRSGRSSSSPPPAFSPV
jgi:methionine-rich copper-binding protein CopC